MNESVIFWRFFIIFNILNVFVQWKNGKFQSPKSSTGTSISVESYTTLKNVISSFKICFQNYGQLKRKCLRPKNTSNAFLKFELSRLGGPMLKTRKKAVRNQFGQQWLNVISIQKPRRVYTAMWYKLKPFAIKKGRFKMTTPAKFTSHVKLSKGGQSTNIKSLKIQNVLRPWSTVPNNNKKNQHMIPFPYNQKLITC